ncbi:MAG: hypothetical protein ABEJ76_07270 [Halanaeroarchaeum sp.]
MRGQTTLDFLVGTSAFLLAVGLVVGLVPGMLDPFTVDGRATPVAGNRAVASLAQDELAEQGEPFVLSESAVDDFFALDDDAVAERLDLQEGVSANVTLDNETASPKTVGPPVPPDRSVTITWRRVSYAGERATLTVRIW